MNDRQVNYHAAMQIRYFKFKQQQVRTNITDIGFLKKLGVSMKQKQTSRNMLVSLIILCSWVQTSIIYLLVRVVSRNRRRVRSSSSRAFTRVDWKTGVRFDVGSATGRISSAIIKSSKERSKKAVGGGARVQLR